MELTYYKPEDYRKALENAKRLVAQNFARCDAKLIAAKASGEEITDKDYEEFLMWQLLSVLVRNQETFCSPDEFESDGEDEGDDDDIG